MMFTTILVLLLCLSCLHVQLSGGQHVPLSELIQNVTAQIDSLVAGNFSNEGFEKFVNKINPQNSPLSVPHSTVLFYDFGTSASCLLKNKTSELFNDTFIIIKYTKLFNYTIQVVALILKNVGTKSTT